MNLEELFSKYNHQKINQSFIMTLIVEKKDLKEILTELKNDFRFTILTDLFAADFPSRENRFEVVYNLLSLEHNKRIILKITLNGEESADSVSDIFSAANWYEREVFDLFGIKFNNHPNLERILTDYGFNGHPLRKDFPLTGYVEVRYDKDQEKVIYEPVKLDQEYRTFDFISPWEGIKKNN